MLGLREAAHQPFYLYISRSATGFQTVRTTNEMSLAMAGKSYRKQFSPREILSAKPGARRRVNVERRGQQGEQDIDAPPGDLSLNLDSRAQTPSGWSAPSGLAAEQMSACYCPAVRVRTRAEVAWTPTGRDSGLSADWIWTRIVRGHGLDIIPDTLRRRTGRGRDCGQVANVDCSLTRTNCGRGRGLVAGTD